MNASGENSRPSCASSVNTGTNDSVMTSSEKNSAGPTSSADSVTRLHRSATVGGRRRAVLERLEVLVRVLDQHDGGIDHRAERDRDAAQAEDVRADALPVHHDERGQHADRQRDHRDERRAQVEQEDGADQRDDDELLDELVRRLSTARSMSSERS